MIQEGKSDLNLISRREFITRYLVPTVAVGGTAVVVRGEMLLSLIRAGATQNTSSTSIDEDDARATIAASSDSVRATSVAKSPQEFQAEMDKLPESIRRSSVIIYPVYDMETYEIGGNGTATIVDYDAARQVYWGITAKHVFLPPEGKSIMALYFTQPHTATSMNYDKFTFSSFGSDETGFSVFGFRNRPEKKVQWGVLGRENVEINYKPRGGEKFFALSFPAAAQGQEQDFPIQFRVLEGGFYDKFTQNTGLFASDSLIAGGASGVGVGNQEGKLIGIISAFNMQGGWITPIGPEFHTLKEEVLSRFSVE